MYSKNPTNNRKTKNYKTKHEDSNYTWQKGKSESLLKQLKICSIVLAIWKYKLKSICHAILLVTALSQKFIAFKHQILVMMWDDNFHILLAGRNAN